MHTKQSLWFSFGLNCCLKITQNLAPSLQNQVNKHGVEHYIVTNGPPVHTPPWGLTAQKLALAKAEFQQLERVGIIAIPIYLGPSHCICCLNPLGDGDRTTIIATLTLLRLRGGGGAETARGVKMLCAAQKLIARIFSNFMTFPDFYSSKSWCNF